MSPLAATAPPASHKSCTTLYLEKGAVLLGDNDRTHYPILPGVIPSENEVDEYYLTGWEATR